MVGMAIRFGVGILLALMRIQASAQADSWGPWKTVQWRPYGSDRILTDDVRIKHYEHGTRCDFATRDRLDVKLIALDATVRMCIPGRVVSIQEVS